MGSRRGFICRMRLGQVAPDPLTSPPGIALSFQATVSLNVDPFLIDVLEQGHCTDCDSDPPWVLLGMVITTRSFTVLGT